MRIIYGVLFLVFSGNGYAQYTKQQSLGDQLNQRLGSVIPLSTGGALMTGYTTKGTLSTKEVLLIKIDAFGDTVWTRAYGTNSTASAIGTKCIELASGQYVITGQIDNRILLLKTDTNGFLVWQKKIKAYGVNDYGYDLIENSRGEIIIGGKTSTRIGNTRGYIVMTDSLGRGIWHETYGRGNDYATALSIDKNDGFISVGYGRHSRYSLAGNNGLVVKYSSSKNLEWAFLLGSNSSENLNDVITAKDGSFITVGYYGAAGGGDGLMTKISNSGQVLWSKTYGGSNKESLMSVKQTANGGYIAVGTTASFGNGLQDIYAVRTDAKGDTIWTKAYGGSTNDGGAGGSTDLWISVSELKEGGFAIATYTTSFGKGGEDAFIIQVDSNGHASNCNEKATQTSVLSPTLIKGFSVVLSRLSTATASDTSSLSTQSPLLSQSDLLPKVSLNGNASLCIGDTTVLVAKGAASYVWGNGLGISDTVQVAPAITSLFKVTGSDTNSCTNSAYINLIVNALPSIQIIGKDSICFGDSTLLFATGGTSYMWNKAIGVSDTVYINPKTPTVYEITGTDTNGCSNSVQKRITINALPTIQVSGDTIICVGDTAVLNVNGAITYRWNGGVETGKSLSVSPSINSTYSVVGFDLNSCTDTSLISIRVNPLPTILASGGATICSGDSTVLTVTGGSSYLWAANIGTGAQLKVAPDTTSTYQVLGTDSNGCSNTSHVLVSVKPLPNTTIYQDREVLMAQNIAAGVSYQWIDCLNENKALFGATKSTFSPTVNGRFAVVLVENGCTDTSKCHDVKTVGIAQNSPNNLAWAFPNPTKGNVSIGLKEPCSSVNIEVININGEVIQSHTFKDCQNRSLTIKGEAGVYLLRVKSSDLSAVFRIVKE